MIPSSGYPEPGGESFTSGHSGTDTSHEARLAEARSGTAAHRQEEVLDLLRHRPISGITVKELRNITGWHHGQASAALSNLHKAGQIARLVKVRDRCKVYVLPGYVDGEPTEEFASRVKAKRSDGLNDDAILVLKRVADIPLPEFGNWISTSMRREFIEAARREVERLGL